MQVSILVGKAAMLNSTISSAIHKQPILTRQYCDFTGLVDDTQVSTAYHGGVERALHYYPKEHYAYWQAWFLGMGLKSAKPLLSAGGFGENISGTGLIEQEVCIGDIYRLDNALIQISQPRSPCYKLNARFSYPAFSVLVQANGRTGWLLRVLETGEVGPEANLALVERPYPNISVKRAADIVYNQAFNPSGLAELAALTSLSPSWRKKAREYLAAGQVTDWSMRLLGPDLPASGQL
ncbi:MOSC domain-containing protein [Oceanisphaera pacifica]|uniref:MOSC domain-containing protein n=1 Tax=Oceanisphaera pacifica TaxID=2818389 RepID=A0ABS3NHM5_9GAMM|nr:MOSC domain-containing protein [Oceanisphaera pacifica]MBO1520093.1 MOSC domain-containing protein [Oceanisphaera pacifica]